MTRFAILAALAAFAARTLLDRRESGPHVLTETDWYNWCPSVLLAPDGKYR